MISSVREKGGFEVFSTISQYGAHIMFAIHAVMLDEIVKQAKNDRIGYSEYVFFYFFFKSFLMLIHYRAYTYFKQYLTSGHETPMAYYYNTAALLTTIRSDEANSAAFSCTDERGREFSYQGNLIRVDDIKKMISDLQHRYVSVRTTCCFFGEGMPPSLFIEFEVESLVDNLQNTAPGYSFLDDPRNPFDAYRSSYGEWLLSDPERAARFVFVHEGELVWRPKPCLDLLRKMQEIRQLLLLLCIFTAGPSSRASEVARQLLRNVPGSYRNLLILFHAVCLVDIQDKTSHKHLKDKYIPHLHHRQLRPC